MKYYFKKKILRDDNSDGMTTISSCGSVKLMDSLK